MLPPHAGFDTLERMRLRDTLWLLNANVGPLSHTYSSTTLPNGTPGGQIDRFTTWIEAVRILSEIPALKKYAKAVFDHPLVVHPTGAAIIGPRPEVESLNERLNTVQSRAQDLLTLLSELLPQRQPPTALSVRLPEFSSFDDLSEIVEELKRIFDVPNRRLHRDGFTITGFDSGSQWIEMVTPLVTVLTTTAWLIRIAHKCLDRRTEMQNSVDRLKIADGSVDRHMAAIVEANDKLLKEELREACSQVVEANSPEDLALKTESVTLLLDAAERLTGLLERGAAVKLSLNAPKIAMDALPGGKDIVDLVLSVKKAANLLGSGGGDSTETSDSDDDTGGA